MEIIPEVVKSFITLTDAFVCIFVLAGIIGILWGIIWGLAIRAGSFRNLFRLTPVADNHSHDATDKKNITNNHPKE
jgi:hypothetical protein